MALVTSGTRHVAYFASLFYHKEGFFDFKTPFYCYRELCEWLVEGLINVPPEL